MEEESVGHFTKIYRDLQKGSYLVISFCMDVNFRFISKMEKQPLEPIATIYGLKHPLGQDCAVYLSKEELIDALSKSGVNTEEFEEIKKRIS